MKASVRYVDFKRGGMLMGQRGDVDGTEGDVDGTEGGC